MKTITTNKRTLLFVEVPEDWTREDYILHWKNEHYAKPNHDYRFIATTDTITEEQAAMFVENKHDNPLYFKNYYIENGACMYATVSFATLLQYHSITGRHAIIEVL